MNYEQTSIFLALFKTIIEMTKTKNTLLTTHDIEKFNTDNESFKVKSSEEIFKTTTFLHDNYNHIVGCILDGYIIPILPSSFDYKTIFEQKINLISYYNIKSSELKNAKDMIIFLENVFMILSIYRKGRDMKIIKNICTPLHINLKCVSLLQF